VGQPAFAGGYLVVPGPPTGDSALNGALALDATTGMTVWAVKVPTAVRPYPVIAGGTVYLGADNGILYAIDLASGVQRWAAETGAPISSAPAVSGGLVFVPGAGSVLGAYDAATGAEVWTAPVPVTELGGITAAPTSEGTTVILVGDDIGVLHAFDAAGAEVWAVEVTDASLTRWRPTVVDGVVYASGMDGTLHALAAQDSGIGTPAPTPGPAQGTTPVPRPGDLILPPLKATETPVPVQVPTPTPAPVVAQVPTPTLAPTPPPAPTPADQAVYADAGLVEPGYYVSPHTSTEIRWDTVAWELDPWFDPPVVSSNAGDELYLAVTTQNGVSMAVYIYPSYGDTMDEIMSFVSSSTNIADVFGPDAEVVLNTAAGPRGALVVRDASGGFDPWMIYSEFYLVNDGEVLVEVQLVAPASMATEAITAAQAQITLDGQPVMTFYPTADVAAALGS
jgi:hypothetical protein